MMDIMADLEVAARSFAGAPDIPFVPDVMDLASNTPFNPPQEIQQKFVGTSYEGAYAEAAAFVGQAREWATSYGQPLDSADRLLDFGSGWGRISRLLMTLVPTTCLHLLDVDPSMTALVNCTLPGANAITVDPFPPSVLGDDTMDHVLAFSVFSHLAESASSAWAEEFGRVLRPGGLAFVTVLDEYFLSQVASCQEVVRAGGNDAFAVSLAAMFPDLEEAERTFSGGGFVYGDAGDDGARSGDFYGWAMASRPWMEGTWGRAGFEILEWVPSGVLFPQAMVCLRRTESGPANQVGS